MTEAPPARVRVTGPPRLRTRRPRTGDIDEQTALGDVYLRSLMRDQLGLALRIGALLVVGIGSWPLLFHLVPALADVRLFGVPLSWWLLGVAVYPALVLLGWRFVRRAERIEQDFADLISERDQ